MAKFFYHEFTPSFSAIVVIVLFVLIDIAFYTGWRSVTVRPRRVSGKKNPTYPDRPKFTSSKAASVRSVFTRSELRNAEVCDSIIHFCSKTRDFIWATLAGVAFAATFGAEHWDGMCQWFINHLAYNDGAAWGDIMAYATLVFLGGGFGCLFYVIREYAQYMHGCILMGKYLKIGKRPILKETPTLLHYAELFKWAIVSSIEEEKQKKAAAEAEKRRKELHRTKKPYNCQIIDMSDRIAVGQNR